MTTTTKKDLIDRISEETGEKRAIVKLIVQRFLDNVTFELGHGNRLEFRDFGVFEIRQRAARMAQNPKTLEPVPVLAKRTVKFKIGRLMKLALEDHDEYVREISRPPHAASSVEVKPLDTIGIATGNSAEIPAPVIDVTDAVVPMAAVGQHTQHH